MTEDERNLRILVGFIISINCAIVSGDFFTAVLGCTSAMQWIKDAEVVGPLTESKMGRLQEECVRHLANLAGLDPEEFYPKEEE